MDLKPREGELLKVSYYGKLKTWAVDVDRPPKTKTSLARALRVLFENKELHGMVRESGSRTSIAII